MKGIRGYIGTYFDIADFTRRCRTPDPLLVHSSIMSKLAVVNCANIFALLTKQATLRFASKVSNARSFPILTPMPPMLDEGTTPARLMLLHWINTNAEVPQPLS